MALLMVDPAPGPLPPEADVAVGAGATAIVEVRQGQLLSIEAVAAGQVAALFAWTASDPGEWLSPHHTRVFGGTFELRMGTRLVTNRRRPIFVVGRDSLRQHDLLLPASEATVAAVVDALAQAGVPVPRIPDPVNLLAGTRLASDGRIEVRASAARPGERWTARVLIDSTVVVAAAVAVAATPTRAQVPKPPDGLRVRVLNDVRDLPDDLPVWPGAGAPSQV